ncbi:MAG: hypothetical protein LIP01_06500 [Tannerellaceae bacterium]|nr:hypothetical protein [Tannerellaceae bacterium]
MFFSCRLSGNSGQSKEQESSAADLFNRYGITLDNGWIYYNVDEIEKLKEFYRSATGLYGLHVGKEESFIFKVQNPDFKIIKDNGCGIGDALNILPEYSYVTLFSGLPSYSMEKQKTLLYSVEVSETGEVYEAGFTYLNLNEELTFEFNGEKYALYETTRENDDSLSASDYKMYLRRVSDNTIQLLSHIDQLEQEKPVIWFVGDIDGDGKLDVLIDERRNYEQYKMKLFLSSFAEDGELMKGVAIQEEWRGC